LRGERAGVRGGGSTTNVTLYAAVMTIALKSFMSGQWLEGKGNPVSLMNPSTEEALATATTQGLDFGAAVRFAREKGGPALRELSFAQRGEVLRKLAKVVSDGREELIGIGI